MTVTWQMERAQLLRHAANTIRARAQAATRGPWTSAWLAVRTVSDQYPVLASEHNRDSDLTYAAMMHPLVGAALADLLDEVAGHAESNDEYDGFPPESVITGYTPAVTIARLINGNAS